MKIKEIRSMTGLSQVKFAEALNIPRRTLENWEAGTRECPKYVVDLIEYRVTHDRKLRKKPSKPPIDKAVLEELSNID